MCDTVYSNNSEKHVSVSELASQSHGTPLVLIGRIIHKRALSKRLMFCTIADKSNEDITVEIAFKSTERDGPLSPDTLINLRAALKTGDVVLIPGVVDKGSNEDGEMSLLCTGDMKVVEAWGTLGRGAFVSRQGNWKKKKEGKEGDDNLKTGICKFFINTGKCPNKNCRFEHTKDKDTRNKVQASWVVQRREKLLIDGQEEDDPHGGGKQSHCQRAKVFADWLLSTFGRNILTQGQGVLDIAGGRGDLSFELHSRLDIPCTLVDPRRSIALSRQQRKFLHKKAATLGNSKENSGHIALQPSLPEGTMDTVMPVGSSVSLNIDSGIGDSPLLPPSISTISSINYEFQLDNDSSLITPIPQRESSPPQKRHKANQSSDDINIFSTEPIISFFPDKVTDINTINPEIRDKDMMKWEQQGLLCNHIRQPFDLNELRTVCEKASLLVGLHPDQATDVIIDSAILLGRPFAVVPCCVFARTFPDRRGPHGNVVATYEELVEYLVAKQPGARIAYLPFKGRNKVVYWLGPSQQDISG